MEEFLAIAILSILAFLATSRRAFRWRKHWAVAALVAGGWFGVATGALLGPAALGLIKSESVIRSTPLLLLGLGWIGLMVGLQLRLPTIRALPRTIVEISVLDFLLTSGFAALIATFGLTRWTISSATDLVPSILLLIAASIGWAMETRSLRVAESVQAHRLSTLIRASGGLSAAIAVLLLGAASVVWTPSHLRSSPGVSGWLMLGAAAGFALLLGLLGRFVFNLTGASRANQLTIFLGVVVFGAGVGVQMGIHALFATFLVGVVLANLAGPKAAGFEMFIYRAEHVVAMLFALLAGVVADLRLGIEGFSLALALAAFRILLKPAFVRFATRRRTREARPDETVPQRSPLYLAPMRQSLLAPALAVGVLIVDPSDFQHRLLGVILVAGFVSECASLVLSARFRRSSFGRGTIAGSPSVLTGSGA